MKGGLFKGKISKVFVSGFFDFCLIKQFKNKMFGEKT